MTSSRLPRQVATTWKVQFAGSDTEGTSWTICGGTLVSVFSYVEHRVGILFEVYSLEMKEKMEGCDMQKNDGWGLRMN
jgi:hypothetical protein